VVVLFGPAVVTVIVEVAAPLEIGTVARLNEHWGEGITGGATELHDSVIIWPL